MRVTMIPILFGASKTAAKGLERGLKELVIRGTMETIQTSALLRSAKILITVLKTCY